MLPEGEKFCLASHKLQLHSTDSQIGQLNKVKPWISLAQCVVEATSYRDSKEV